MGKSKETQHGEKPLCVSYIKLFLKYDQHKCHWVGHSLTNPVDFETKETIIMRNKQR